MQNVDLFLLNDNDRINGPVMSYNDPKSHLIQGFTRGEIGGNERLIKFIADNLATGPVTRTINGKTHQVGRTVNWVFVHRGEGNLSGESVNIGGIGGSDASLFVTTAVGDVTALTGQYFPLSADPLSDTEIVDTLVHETAHLLGAEHKYAEGCPTKEPFFGGELGCSNPRRQRYFGARNVTAMTPVIKAGLARCNNAYSSQSSCENQVDNECALTADYTRIAACQAELKVTYCSDLCPRTALDARVVINAMPTIINEPNYVSAPAR
jgi:hypothetical protein